MASLLCSTFPSYSFLYSRAYKAWGGGGDGELFIVILSLKGKKIKLKIEKRNRFFFFFGPKKRYQLKVKEKNFKSGFLSISSFYMRKQRLRRASPRSNKRLKIQDQVCLTSELTLGFPSGSDGKESACNAGDSGSIPGSGRAPGEGNGNPLQYSCLENPMDRGAWQANFNHEVKCSRTVLPNRTYDSDGKVLHLCCPNIVSAIKGEMLHFYFIVIHFNSVTL